jgi:hypothetical protein
MEVDVEGGMLVKVPRLLLQRVIVGAGHANIALSDFPSRRSQICAGGKSHGPLHELDVVAERVPNPLPNR